ncbi:hypothetical protein T4D_1974 [Trichinella pseudospiralis]|uniref:Uncharacterized protein n=1 Tax=Trichinella pseudospiralis TaxID=6337 RepID=A0A0V1F842_TRIPS|nr:hypothetical protein T4D_1974 [Trichinella pseudospiralis]
MPLEKKKAALYFEDEISSYKSNRTNKIREALQKSSACPTLTDVLSTTILNTLYHSLWIKEKQFVKILLLNCTR